MSAREPLDAPSDPSTPAEGADGIEPELRSLVRAYVAYLSGCDTCTMDSLRVAYAVAGDIQRLRRMPTWRRAPLYTYSDRERMALVWVEVVAVLGEEGIGEELRRQATELFSAEELAVLTRTVLATRGYRRMLLERTGSVRPERRRPARRADPCGSQESCELCAT